MPRRRAAITKAELDRLIKAGQDAGLREVLIDVNGVKITYQLAVDSGENAKAKVAKTRRALI